ncbi:hypothetical protein [Luteitalea sp.]|jgi:hypothetical protein|uniref:putative iron-sulfur cluster-binding metallochaperone n=1 Tax=Luteitalea sp. TaxID=2004800 RepID=UPI0025B7B8C3|nr:hypothetical protein [Luteitalea sp.]
MSGDSPDCCCQPPVARVEAPHCPHSQTRGMRVPLDTVKALLRDTAMRRLSLSEHAFCPDPDCRVVYFTADGDVYLTTDIRVAVWQKEPFGARTVCYCFGENEADMRNEIDRTGTSEAVARVRAHIKAQRCACEVRNPRGACCLGDVTEAAKRVAAAAAVER